VIEVRGGPSRENNLFVQKGGQPVPSKSAVMRQAVDPRLITDLATAYWASMVLLTANRFNIFGFLSEEPLSAVELSARTTTEPRSLEMLLNACVGHGLLECSDGRYRNSTASDAFLVRGKPSFLGDALKYSEDMYPLWGRLGEAVASNAPPVPPETILGGDAEKTENFVRAMHNRALGIAKALTFALDLSGRRKLLDVGGGPGTYSALLVQKTPGLEAVVLDLGPVVAIAKEIVAEFGVSDRIRFISGDYKETPFGEEYDAVLVSGVLHRETGETCRSLLDKTFACLTRGGVLYVADIFFEDQRKVSPPFATLFALNMLLTSESGGAHAIPEMTAWMEQSGFDRVEVRPLPPPMPHSIVLGRKP